MKRILYQFFGYSLCIAAGLGALLGISKPENLVAYGIVSAYAGCLGYLWIKKARNATKQLDAPETQRLEKP